MADQLLHHWWDAPTLGEFPALPPDAIPDGGARALRNFLVHLPNKIVPRGGIGGTTAAEIGTLAHPSGHAMGGHYTIGNDVVIDYRVSAASPTVDPWRGPINRPTSAGDLTQPVTGTAQDGAALSLITGTVTQLPVAAGATDAVSGYRYAFLGGATYTNTLGGTSTAVPTGVAQLTRVLKASGSGQKLTNGPGFVQDVIAHYNRLFVAAARRPGGADYDPSQLFWTIDGGTTALTDVLTDWQDPTTGLVNTIVVGASNDEDFIVALGRARGHLVIFKRRSVWILYGTNTEDFTLRQLRTSLGCVDARSVVVCDEGVYFASQQGFELFDGTNFSTVSVPVADTWLEFIARGPGAATVNYGYVTATALPNNYLFVTLGTTPHTAFATDGAEVSWLYYVPTGAWVRVTSAISTMGLNASGAFNRAIATPNAVALWGASTFARADRLTYAPDVVVGLRDRDASSSFSVPLSWTTGIADVGRRWEAARFNRGTVDYRHTWLDTAPADGAAMGTAAVYNDAGTIIATPGTLPGYRPTTAPLRVRPTFDTNHEAPQGGVEMVVASNIGSSSSARTGSLAIYGAGIEHQTGRGRRKA
jgi:hypothetical protein